ncbi:hypothetical protein M231_02246 [Tremella mesenterica]|uniref:VLRF1 domain-containing protein n=1 Tax=Tremella mesenterica TaxID=5217 RepID=A0A4Q1BR43_TREME|nr:uncharacterized protein TREMEDRAFT_34773 [Tremella mesenterica DSM 1558]EIW66569.1 hypothetical protein TREMEDRAFT_34773 [Tremella mesenterica DSM 1558]RXK40413.1 hypothetical protein M231_02246 [Tremella mesenterica]
MTSILNRAINVYSLPSVLLDNLQVRSIQAEPPSSATAGPSTAVIPTGKPTENGLIKSQVGSGLFSCQTCPQATFETVQSQREHFQSDWHRYNMKIKQNGVVTAEQFDQMVENLSSISGSESGSSSSSSNSSDQDKVSKLLRRQRLQPINEDEEALELADRQRRAHLRTAIIWFAPNSPIEQLGIPKDTQFGIHRALFPPFERATEYLDELKKMQLSNQNQMKNGEEEEEEERRMTLLMVAGGHFAGMVVGIRPKGKGEKQDVKGAGEVRVLQHKTFHRYTTRKKQGGSQSINDNAKSKAISAGAMLRRYGEQALQEEIRALMVEWKEDIDLSERIFIRASTHGRKSFWGYEGAVLDKGDPRIRVFPFPTRRPTQSELLRCWHELIRVRISHLTEEALRQQDEEYITSLQPRKPTIKPSPLPSPITQPVQKKDPEEIAREDRHRRLEEMIIKGRLESLRPFWEKYKSGFSSDVLSIASQAGQEEIVKFLLEEKVDPTLPLDDGARRSYDVASTKGVRNVFRRMAYDHPDWWDWKAAHVPSGLSEEQEVAQEQKKMERKRGLREKMKEREKSKAVEVVEPIQQVKQETSSVIGPTQKLGGKSGEGGLEGLSNEMRLKIEREKRARAAEARFK